MTRLVSLGVLASLAVGLVNGQLCPDLPDGVNLGEAVPINPGDVPGGCSDFEILVARGTSEPNAPGGKFGVIVGDPVVSNATEILAGVRGYPVQYPASISITSPITGRRDVIDRLEQQDRDCPGQTFALVGYSQGASVMHSALERLDEDIFPKIKSLVMFGDPDFDDGASAFPEPLRQKVFQNCAEGDLVCDPDGLCFYDHLTYIRPAYIDRSVDFIVNAFRGTPLPPSYDIGL